MVDKLHNIELKCYHRTHQDSYWDRMCIIHHLHKILIVTPNIYLKLTKVCTGRTQNLNDHGYLGEKEKQMGLRRSTKWASTKSVKFCLKNRTAELLFLKV